MTTPATYVGPKLQITPDQLSSYENGKWACEAKLDGHWCELKTDSIGNVKSMTSRAGNTMNRAGLVTTLPANSTFVGEFMHGTEAAARRNKVEFVVFDVTQLLGTDTRQFTLEQRRELLENIKFGTGCVLVERRLSGFRAFFEDVTATGGEGLVLKRLGKKYQRGKTEDWVRVKLHRYVDYVVMSVGKSDGGQPNIEVGLYVNNKLTRVATVKNLPKGFDFNNIVGRVIEVKGLEVHASGALRHGHYERMRDDKPARDCTLAAARAIGGYTI